MKSKNADRLGDKLIRQNRAGDDRNLSEAGATDPYYMYSIQDVKTVQIALRKKLFTFLESKVGVIGDELYGELAQNDQRILLLDACTSDNLNLSLNNAAHWITGDASSLPDDTQNPERLKWPDDKLPSTIIIPLLEPRAAHWRNIRVKINDGDTKNINILWDDPYGDRNGFSDDLKNSIKTSLTEFVRKLYTVDQSEVLYEVKKSHDQQGYEKDGWSCGTVCLSNIEDYLIADNRSEENSSFGSIGRFTLKENVNDLGTKSLLDSRIEHIKMHAEVFANKEFNADEISDIRKAISDFDNFSDYRTNATKNIQAVDVNTLSKDKFILFLSLVAIYKEINKEKYKSGAFLDDQAYDYAMQILKAENTATDMLVDQEFSSPDKTRAIQEELAQLQISPLRVKKGLKFATDPDTFEGVVTSDIFVDKSLFIKEIIDASEDHILITRPRRWGKTLNMDMLRNFFQPEVDENGKFDFDRPGKNSKLFAGGELELEQGKKKACKKLSPLKIAQEKDKDGDNYIKSYQGQHPVIFVSFKDCYALSVKEKGSLSIFDSMENAIKTAISNAYREHSYLRDALHKNSQEGNSYDKKRTAAQNLAKFNRILDGKDEEGITQTLEDISNSLKFLAQLLQEHYDRKVYILVDEYDAPVSRLLEQSLKFKKPPDIEAIENVSTLITAVLSACGKPIPGEKSFLEKIILVGVTDTLKKENSGLNNVKVFDVTMKKFSTSFGFFENEIKEQIDVFLTPNDRKEEKNPNREEKIDAIMQKIIEWYNGYTVTKELTLYTPWAVMNYLYEVYQKSVDKEEIAEPKGYWLASGISSVLENLNHIPLDKNLLNKLKDLALGNEVMLNYKEGTVIPENLKEMLSGSSSEKLTTHLLVSSGYITKGSVEGHYKIPNKEVSTYFQEKVLEKWIQDEFGDVNLILEEFVAAMEAGGRQLTVFLENKVLNPEGKAFDENKTESDFQGIIHGFTVLAELKGKAKHSSSTEVQVSRKQIDGLFLPIKHKSSSILLHEYKIEKSQNYEKVSEDGHWQIYGRNYLAAAIKKGDKDTIIKTRVITFYKGAEKSLVGAKSLSEQYNVPKWQVHMIENEHTLPDANVISAMFEKNPEPTTGGIKAMRIYRKGVLATVENAWNLNKLLDGLKTRAASERENEEDINNVYRTSTKRQKVSEEEEIAPEQDNAATGIMEYANGMTDRDIELNLRILKQSITLANQQDSYYLEKNMLNKDNVIEILSNWTNNKRTQSNFLSVIALISMEGKKHAVVLQIERVSSKLNDNGPQAAYFKLKIIEPVSEKDSEFKEVLSEVEGKLSSSLSQYGGVVAQTVYAGVQDCRYGTCGDMSLIILKALSEEKSLGEIISYHKSIMAIASDPNDIGEESDQSQLKSQDLNLIYFNKLTTQNNNKIGSEDPIIKDEDEQECKPTAQQYGIVTQVIEAEGQVSHWELIHHNSKPGIHIGAQNGFLTQFGSFAENGKNIDIQDMIDRYESSLPSVTDCVSATESEQQRVKASIMSGNTLYKAMKIRDMKNLAQAYGINVSKVQASLSDKGAGIFSDIFSNDGLDKQYYRKFSLELHPDKNGSNEAMQDLNNIYDNGSTEREKNKVSKFIGNLGSGIDSSISYLEKTNSAVVIVHEIGNLFSLIQKEFNGEKLSVREQISGAASQVKIYNAASALYNGGSVYTFGLGVDAIADGVYFGYSAFQNDHSEFIAAKSKFLTSLNYSVATSISHGTTLSTTAALGIPLLGKVAIVAHGTSYTTGLLKSYTHSWIGEGGYADYYVTGLDNTVKTIAQPIIFTTEAISAPIASIQGELGWLNKDTKFQNNIHGLELSKKLYDLFSWVTPKFVYDFEQDSKWYQNKIDKANELESYKRHFAKTNTQKLYDGIYKLALEQKYALINSGTSAEDAKEWMESKFKSNVTIKAPEVGNYSEDSQKYLYKYDMCFEMNSYEHGKQYHCYSKSANTVDSILAGSQHDQFEVIDGYIEHTNVHLEM